MVVEAAVCELFYKKGRLTPLRPLHRSLVFVNVGGFQLSACNFVEKEALVQVFPLKLGEVFKNTC